MHIKDVLVPQNFRHPTSWGFNAKNSLDLGCGHKPRNPFGAHTVFGVDLIDEEEFSSNLDRFAVKGKRTQFKYTQVKRSVRLPFPNSSFDAVTAYDFLEHLSREPTSGLGTNEFIFLLNEVSRLLRKGGVFLAVTPAFPSPSAFQDPTHVNIISEKTVEYFVSENSPAHTFGYGFEGKFSLIRQFWLMPFNKIMDNGPYGEKHPPKSNLSKFRNYFANIRKPTHLVWLLEKK